MVGEDKEREEVAEIASQAGACLATLISYAKHDSVKNFDAVEEVFRRLGEKLYDFSERGD